MGIIQRFEDIKAWQKARDLNNKIYKIIEYGKFKRDFPLRNQIENASISIMSNIAEGFARKTDREFRQFLVYARGSSAEVQSDLYIALDQKYISGDDFDSLYSTCGEISKMLVTFSKYLTKEKNK